LRRAVQEGKALSRPCGGIDHQLLHADIGAADQKRGGAKPSPFSGLAQSERTEQ
jgi:hypothetical protein